MAKIWLGVVALCLAACSSSANPPASEDRPEESEPPETPQPPAVEPEEVDAPAEAVVEETVETTETTTTVVDQTPESTDPPVREVPPNAQPLTYGLLWAFQSQQLGLGNLSDPALLELPDGMLRLFFKNGNEPQMGLSGFDNKIHSFVSGDGGLTWELEDGVRIDAGSPVSVSANPDGGYDAWGWRLSPGGDQLTRFSSTDGSNFSVVGGSTLDTSSCLDTNGRPAGVLGDPQVERVADGYIAYAHDLGSGMQPPFTRQGCKLVSSDGVTWEIDGDGTFAFSHDIQTNPELYRNADGVLELWFPADRGMTKTTEIRISSDGNDWELTEQLSWMANDPDRLDTSDGRELLAFGNFDHRQGGLLAVSERIESTYHAVREETPDGVRWELYGAEADEVSVQNLCFGSDETDSLSMQGGNGAVLVEYRADPAAGFGATNCVFLVVGDLRALT